jgi:chromosome segregation ATPase
MPLTRARKAEQTQATAAADDVSSLRSRTDQVTAALKDVDDALRAAENERDAALVQLQSLAGQSATKDAIATWRAEEARDAALARIDQLLVERGPLAAEAARLAGYLAPLDAARRRLEADRLQLERYERLAAVLPLIDQVTGAIEDAARGSKDVPPSLIALTRTWGKTSGTRARVGNSIRANLDSLRGHIARTEAGL